MYILKWIRGQFCNNLARDLRKKIKNEEKASGIETEMTNLEKALEDLIEREDAAA